MEICDRCGQFIEPGEIRYYVRVTVSVDDGGVILEPIDDVEIDHLIDQLSSLNEEQMTREVHSDQLFLLCPSCRYLFMKNPIGRTYFDDNSDESDYRH
jgi:hypothetical protein